jgi:adenylosuccinate lyase
MRFKLDMQTIDFDEKDAARIKQIEKTTNHDVKAVEYFVKEKLEKLGLKNEKEFVHFGLTSQDINNTAFPLMMKMASLAVFIPQIKAIIAKLNTLSKDWKNVSMLAHTHGQPASPTRLGKEIAVFAERLENQLKQFQAIPYTAKFGGATGNFKRTLCCLSRCELEKICR